jgi:hypothetical protein
MNEPNSMIHDDEPTGDDWKDMRKVLDMGPLTTERHRLREAIDVITRLRAALAEAKREAEVAKGERNRLSNEHREVHLLRERAESAEARVFEAEDKLVKHMSEHPLTQADADFIREQLKVAAALRADLKRDRDDAYARAHAYLLLLTEVRTNPMSDCPGCDYGMLRPRVDGTTPEHWPDCLYARIDAAIK